MCTALLITTLAIFYLLRGCLPISFIKNIKIKKKMQFIDKLQFILVNFR